MPRVAPAIELNPMMKATLHHLARSASTPQALALLQSHCLGRGCGTGQSADRHRPSGSRSHGRQVAPLFCQPGSGGLAGCSSFRTPTEVWSGNPAEGAEPGVPAAGTLQPLERAHARHGPGVACMLRPLWVKLLGGTLNRPVVQQFRRFPATEDE